MPARFLGSAGRCQVNDQCAYCGFEFNVLPQLRDRNWAYRRSGLFGREDNQRGGIPAAVTLQQLETMLHGRPLAYAPGIDLKPGSAPVENCETDFVVLVSSFPHADKPVELAIAECKDAGGEISEEDVRKLSKVAQALEKSPCQVFILFSKCGRFTNEEIERCRAARRKVFEYQGKTHYAHNVIMLSEREQSIWCAVLFAPEGPQALVNGRGAGRFACPAKNWQTAYVP